MKKILIIVGTRPNFIKVTQFKKEADKFPNVQVYIAHTGQHYDQNMSNVFFEQFELVPDYFLEVHNSSVCSQLGETIIKIEQVANEIQPAAILAVGDVNSTLAASIVANKMGIPLGHVESGLRSGDRDMPEEINRILTDEITDFYFVTEKSGIDNLLREGKPKDKIHFVGNTMIDTMVAFQEEIGRSDVREKLGVAEREYILLTIHRPSNVDSEPKLEKVLDLIEQLQKYYTVIFPIHPRTKSKMNKFNLDKRFESFENVVELPPMDYFSFQNLIQHSKLVITDSGGIQEETTFIQVPCLTLRDNTERPSTITIGTNELMEFDIKRIVDFVLKQNKKKGAIPELWDGKSTGRILQVLNEKL